MDILGRPCLGECRAQKLQIALCKRAETLEKVCSYAPHIVKPTYSPWAIELIHSEPKWGSEVVYGDTDSLLIYLPSRTRAQAFGIGEDIARTVTSMKPKPVKLKFEKVYHPCIY